MFSLTKDELTRLLTVVKEKNETHWLMIYTTFAHGLRASEICRVARDDKSGMKAGQIQSGYIYIPRRKGSLESLQALDHNEKEPLEKLVSRLKPGDYVFPYSTRYFQKLMNKYGRLAGLPPKKSTPHKLKHTCAMLCLDSGMQINEVQKKLGHRSLSSTGQYTKVSDERADKAFARVLEGLKI